MRTIALTAAFICVLLPIGGMAQSPEVTASSPSPSSSPYMAPPIYDRETDLAYQQCYATALTESDAQYTNNDPATSPFWESSLVQCLAKAKDYVGAADVARDVLKAMSVNPNTEILNNDGDFYYSVALSYWKTGDSQDAHRFIELAYREALANSFGDCHIASDCIQDRRLLLSMNAGNQRALNRRFAADDRVQTRQVENQIARDEAGMSKDQKQVYENEGMNLPCHKAIYDHGDNYHKVTWWYCDDHGRYRKAYTFLNGELTDTYTP